MKIRDEVAAMNFRKEAIFVTLRPTFISSHSYSLVISPHLRFDAHGGTGDPCLVHRFAHSQKRTPSHAVRVATRRATAKFPRDLRSTHGSGVTRTEPTYLPTYDKLKLSNG